MTISFDDAVACYERECRKRGWIFRQPMREHSSALIMHGKPHFSLCNETDCLAVIAEGGNGKLKLTPWMWGMVLNE